MILGASGVVGQDLNLCIKLVGEDRLDDLDHLPVDAEAIILGQHPIDGFLCQHMLKGILRFGTGSFQVDETAPLTKL